MLERLKETIKARPLTSAAVVMLAYAFTQACREAALNRNEVQPPTVKQPEHPTDQFAGRVQKFDDLLKHLNDNPHLSPLQKANEFIGIQLHLERMRDAHGKDMSVPTHRHIKDLLEKIDTSLQILEAQERAPEDPRPPQREIMT